MSKIVLLGAGRVVFAKRLIQDLVDSPVLQGSQISLMDIDPARLELMGAYARRLVNMTLPVRVCVGGRTVRDANHGGTSYLFVLTLDRF